MTLPRRLLALPLLCIGCASVAPAGTEPDAVGGVSSDSTAAGYATGSNAPRDAGLALTLVADPTCVNPCTFRAGGSVMPARVVYRADSWVIGESVSSGDGFATTYRFQETGERHVVLEAYSADGTLMGSAGAWIDVRPAGEAPGQDGASATPLPDVPYFYQYANRLSPGSSCQNTTIAMVLAMQGWEGDPDVITEYWGKDHAQSPAGFSEVLSSEAAYWGLGVRSTPRTNASIGDLQALLDRGLPVPVHGYFTDYGHVLLVLGYDADGYWVHDPAGEWSGRFRGGYPGGWDATVGDAIHYPKAAFEAAVGTSDGSTPLPLWIHELAL